MPTSGGEPHRLTLEHASIPSPPAWTRDGHSIIFSSTRRSIPALWEIPGSAEPVQVPQVGVVALHPSVSPKGNRLAYDQILGSSSIWVVELVEIDDKNSRMQVTATGPQSSRRTAKKSCLNPTGQGQWRSGPAREMVPV